MSNASPQRQSFRLTAPGLPAIALQLQHPAAGTAWADVGYGSSDRYPADLDHPACRLEDARADLRRVVSAVRARNGDRPVALLAHSRGCVVAARYAAEFARDVSALALFAPVVSRPARVASTAQSSPSHYLLTAWAQYRRFIEDLPRDEPQVLSEAHMHEWGTAFLASDKASSERSPPSVNTPY